MKVMITGCDGYLGWPLLLYLLAKGHKIIGIDNLSRRRRVREVGSWSATPIASPFKRFVALHEEFPFFEWRVMDLCNYEEVDYVFEKHKPDAVVHLGEIPSAPYSMIDVKHCNETMMNNIIGTNNILYAMKKHTPDCHMIKLGCYDDKTEVLTEDGWKLFRYLEKTDKVCCLEAETEAIVYSHPEKIVEYPYEGKLLQIKTKQFDFLVTPNHNIVYRHRPNPGFKAPIHIERADELEGEHHIHYYIPRGGKWEGVEKETFTIPSMKLRGAFGWYRDKPEKSFDMDSWLDFFGWYITEGCISYNESEPVAVSMSQSKYVDDMRKAIANVGLHATETKCKDGCINFWIAHKQVATYLDQFGLSHEKYIPKELKALSTRQLKILFESLMRGDGNWTRYPTSGRYDSNSKRLVDDVQEICLKIGKAGLIGSYYTTLNDKKSERPTYYVHFSEATNNWAGKHRRHWVDYNGKVYCCTVPTHIIMVRRNGKMGWSGNTLGEYGTPNIDIPEGFFEIEYRGRKDRLPFPKQAGSWYHQTKVHDTNNIMFACKIWGLRSTDIMQGVVHGIITKDMERPVDCNTREVDSNLITRFDFDEIFGTALNRFCAQAVIGHDLTLYGKGSQTRGYIALRDSMQCMTIAIENPPDEGECRVFNQFDECYSVNELAEHVIKVSAEFGIEAKTWPLENPRVEAEEHYYNPDREHLPNLGFIPTHTLDDELRITIPELMKYKRRIEEKRDRIKPTVYWRK